MHFCLLKQAITMSELINNLSKEPMYCIVIVNNLEGSSPKVFFSMSHRIMIANNEWSFGVLINTDVVACMSREPWSEFGMVVKAGGAVLRNGLD